MYAKQTGGFGNLGNGLQGRGIQPSANGEGLAGVFAVIEHVGLVTGGVEANVGNAVSLGQARFARWDEFEVLRRRGDVAFPELVVDHDTRFGQVTDHRHIALFSFVRDVCGFLLGHDLRGVPVQRVRLDADLSNARRHRSPVDPTQPVQPRAGTGSAQPVAHRVGAGQDVLLEHLIQRRVVLERTQVFQRTSATGEHQHQRRDEGICRIAPRTARLGHLRGQPAAQTQATDKLAEQRQPGICRQLLFRRFDLERKHRLCQFPHRPASLDHPTGARFNTESLPKSPRIRAFHGIYAVRIAESGHFTSQRLPAPTPCRAGRGQRQAAVGPAEP
jgi:hypothetical protein